MSGQIDCMLVHGQGTPVPYTPGTFQWHVKDVLAVFEVKKNLFGNDLSDSFVHLRGVLDTYSAWIQSATGTAGFSLRPTLRAYAQSVGEVPPPSDQWRAMPPDRHLILHTMMADQIAPLRVIFGYGGYGTEIGLRTGFLKYLRANLNAIGFGPPSLPNLIVAGGASLVKLSGHPYHAPLLPSGRWPIMASTNVNPLLLLLELVWTRISYFAEIGELFGEDLDLEGLAPLLDCVPTQLPGNPNAWGWIYHTHKLTKKQLAISPARVPWEPVELDATQFVIVNALCADEIDIDEPEFRAFLAARGRDVEEFIDTLVRTRLVARDDRKLTLTTAECRCVLLPDGRGIAADDNSGRLNRWLRRYTEGRANGLIIPPAR